MSDIVNMIQTESKLESYIDSDKLILLEIESNVQCNFKYKFLVHVGSV